MNRKKVGSLLVVIIIFGCFAFIVVNGLQKEKLARLEIDANIVGDVYVDGRNVGRTPYGGNFEPKEVTIKLQNYETRVTLQQGIKTIIKRQFDETGSKSAGEIVSFEKVGGNESSLAIISTPDGATVSLDGALGGFTPLKIDGLVGGSHQLVVGASDYAKAEFSINIIPGYKLIAIVDLLAKPSVTPVAVATPVAVSTDVFVKILSTPTGFLRVRAEPTTASTEVGEVHPGDTYKLVGKDGKSGWFNIQINESTSGWITNTYAATVSGVIKN